MNKLNELTIIYDRRISYTCYIGTREQIEATGLIPKGTQWQDGFKTAAAWKVDNLEFRLWRRRPDDAKGRQCEFITCDNWALCVDKPNVDYAEYDIQQKAEELRRLQFLQTPEGQKASRRHDQSLSDARRDTEYQAFKASIPGLVPPRRSRKPRNACLHQEAQP